MDEKKRIEEHLRIQLEELENLQSMFYNPGELRVEDPLVVYEFNNYLKGFTNICPPPLDITINLQIEKEKFQLGITLPREYPQIEPDIIVRNSNLSRSQHMKLNVDLQAYMKGIDKGEACLVSAVFWIQENALEYVISVENVPDEVKEKDEMLVRYWIYSHHIYSKTKRREIVTLAQALKLTGFCMPGKPGLICVEGGISCCNEWWQTIRSMTWKRIFCKVTEECKEDKNEFIKFKSFEEVAFQTSSLKCNHMDMGELLKYLEKHNCSYIFKDIFGVDGKSSN